MENFFYYIQKGVLIIADPAYMGSSEQTLTVRFSDLATNVKALNAMRLVSMYAGDGKAAACKFFKTYLACFGVSNITERGRKLNTDPLLVLWFGDTQLQEEVTKCFAS